MSKLPGKMTRKQHWVPRFYLRHFADSSGQLHAYSRQKGSFFRTNCENLCSMRDLYEVEHVTSMPMRQAMRQTDSMRRTSSRLSYLSSRAASRRFTIAFWNARKKTSAKTKGILMGKPPFASWRQISSSGTLSVCASTRNGHARLPKSCSETFI